MIMLFLLLGLSSAFNAAMDKHNFHYERSIFAYWAKMDNWWGRFWQWFSGPESWKNKYMDYGGKVYNFIFRTALVAFTDAWHFFKFGQLTTTQTALAICAVSKCYMLGAKTDFIAGLAWIVVFKMVHGTVFNPLFYRVLHINPIIQPLKRFIMKNKVSGAWKAVAAILTAAAAVLIINAGGNTDPLAFAIASVLAIAGPVFLMITIDADSPNGLPLIVKTVVPIFLVLLFIAFLNESIWGFAYENYVYHQMPPEGIFVPFVGWVIFGTMAGLALAYYIFRKEIQAWIWSTSEASFKSDGSKRSLFQIFKEDYLEFFFWSGITLVIIRVIIALTNPMYN